MQPGLYRGDRRRVALGERFAACTVIVGEQHHLPLLRIESVEDLGVVALDVFSHPDRVEPQTKCELAVDAVDAVAGGWRLGTPRLIPIPAWSGGSGVDHDAVLICMAFPFTPRT